MITCPICNHTENQDQQAFCEDCGASLEGNKETVLTIKDADTSGRLVFPDDSFYEIDNSQRLIGRVDLAKYTKEDPILISRSHFTIYQSNGKYVIKDGVTNVQNKPSEKNTLLDGKKLDTDAVELKNGDKIVISDIELSFVMGRSRNVLEQCRWLT